MIEKEPEFYPDIHDYLDSLDNSASVDVKNLDYLIHKIMAHTGLSKYVSGLIVKYFFQTIRNLILRGEIIRLNGLGSFYVSSPKVTKNKDKIFIKFKPVMQLSKKLNEDRYKYYYKKT